MSRKSVDKWRKLRIDKIAGRQIDVLLYLAVMHNIKKKSIHLHVFFVSFSSCVLQLMMECYSYVALATSCKSHYEAGRTSSGTYYLTISGFTIQVTLYLI